MCMRGRVHARVHVALLVQHATRMRHIVMLLVALLGSTISHKRCDFREKISEHNTCVLILSATFV
jgi:hypothetical protein